MLHGWQQIKSKYPSLPNHCTFSLSFCQEKIRSCKDLACWCLSTYVKPNWEWIANCVSTFGQERQISPSFDTTRNSPETVIFQTLIHHSRTVVTAQLRCLIAKKLQIVKPDRMAISGMLQNWDMAPVFSNFSPANLNSWQSDTVRLKFVERLASICFLMPHHGQRTVYDHPNYLRITDRWFC